MADNNIDQVKEVHSVGISNGKVLLDCELESGSFKEIEFNIEDLASIYEYLKGNGEG